MRRIFSPSYSIPFFVFVLALLLTVALWRADRERQDERTAQTVAAKADDLGDKTVSAANVSRSATATLRPATLAVLSAGERYSILIIGFFISLLLAGFTREVLVASARNRRLRKEIAERRRTEEALRRVASIQEEIAAACPDLYEVSRIAAERVQELTGAGGAVVEFVDGDELVYVAASGFASDYVGFRLSIDESFSGLSLKTGEILVCDDTETALCCSREAARRIGIRSMIVAPLASKAGGVGVLKIVSERPHGLGEREVNTLSLVAGLIGSAILQCSESERRWQAVAALELSEDRLQASEAELRALFAAMTDVIIVLDAEGRYLKIAPTLQKGLYRPADDLIGKTLHDVYPREQADEFLEFIKCTLETRHPVRVEYSLKIKGERKWFAGIVSPMDGDRALWVARDITERKRMEVELRASEERFRAVFARARVGMAMISPEGECLHCNAAFSEITGYTPEELKSVKPIQLTHPDDMERDEETLSRMMDGEIEGFVIEKRYVRKDGQVIWVRNSVSRVIGDKGERICHVVLCEDITEQKRMERELVAARDAALESARLKSEFLANVSHEIRTPLNGVIGMTELLSDTPLDDEQREFVRAIKSSGVSLLSLINDILDFSKIESGKLSVERVEFDLRDVCEDVVELFAPRASEKGIELSLIFDEQEEIPARLIGDGYRLRQILTNLVSNAVKFTGRGGVCVRVTREGKANGLDAETDLDANAVGRPSFLHDSVHVRFEVEDSGIGIAAGERERLFEPFVQADGSTTRKYGGTGLGLAISKQLVELMGGEIGVESALAAGSTFWFALEFASAEARADASPSDDLHGVRVLVADADAASRSAIRAALRSLGAVVSEASNGEEAIAALRAMRARGEACEVALLDARLTSDGGMELARRIKFDSSVLRTRLVLLTNYGNHAVIEETARAAGADDCLSKPVRRARLCELIASLISRSAEDADAKPEKVSRGASDEFERELRAKADERWILIVEDTPVNQLLTRAMVEKLGYRADVVSNGREALDALARRSYDCVLMDCQMPVMDGYEAARAIRQSGTLPAHLPVIAMTAHALTGDREKCLAAGMDDYLTKPVTLRRLEETLTRWTPPSVRCAESALSSLPLEAA